MTATFCGHKDIAGEQKIAILLEENLQELISEGVISFLLGGYGSFDLLAALVLKNLKTEHPNIQRILVIPYMDREYNHELYDGSVYPPIEGVPKRFAILRRNEWMIEQSDVVITYVTHDWGGASTTLEYAKKKGKKIISVA